jgi:broad specificity phosphatase PhoE
VTELWLVRHAESLGNVDGTHADTELSPRGRAQAARLRRVLENERFDVVFTSPLRRARETASLALPSSVPVVDPRLREIDTGPEDTFIDTSEIDLRSFLENPAPPGDHETGKEFMARVRAWVEELPQRTIVAFTHHAVVREIVGLLGGAPPPSRISPAAIFRFEIATATTIVAWNDEEHLLSHADDLDDLRDTGIPQG